jgi:hypothetical protein
MPTVHTATVTGSVLDSPRFESEMAVGFFLNTSGSFEVEPAGT